jgi:quinol monooxygenase YgiN
MYVSFDKMEDWRRLIDRNIALLQRTAHELLRPFESYSLHRDDDGLGVWVAVESWRPEALLKAINRAAFPTFGAIGFWFDGQKHWTHFRAV